MKKIYYCFCLVIFLFLTSCQDKIEPLDEIEEYTIHIAPTEEGNLQMNYKIVWKVLNSEKEGPLEWVKIGIPNYHIQSLTSQSSSIKDISVSSDDGAYVRINLDRSYYAEETVTMEFSFLQTHIYSLKKEEVQYRIIPGWFDEIQVKQLIVYWEKKDVISENSNSNDDKYYIWSTSLDFGESIQVDIQYNASSFTNLSKNNAVPKNYDQWIIVAVVSIILLFVVIILIFNWLRRDEYYTYRGFSGRNFHHHHWWWYSSGVNHHGDRIQDPRIINRGSSHSGGSSCACACACACAGGGRAGCSRKDFYSNDSEMDQLLSKLNQK